MAKIICKYCGKEEETDRWIPETKKALENEVCCLSCYHWKEQNNLDKAERGEHGYAIIDGVHYVLCPHTDAEVFRGFGGKKFTIRFNDGYETICDNLWCQGEVAEVWKDVMPNNAIFVN
jgi:hypothetical protein